MDPVKRSTHVRVEEDLLEAAQKVAEKRDITFSTLYRRALRRELKYPSIITEIRRLREDVDILKRNDKKNFEFIEDIIKRLEEHAKVSH